VKRAVGAALAGTGLLLAALAFEASTLFVPAAALLALAALSTLWIRLAGRAIRVSRVLEVDRVLEEQPVEARIKIQGSLGLPGAQVHDPLSEGAIAISTPRSREIELRVVSRFPRRGRVTLPTPHVRLGDPLGLAASVSRCSTPAQELLVLPRTERITWREPGGRPELHSAGAVITPEPIGAAELDGLRHYRPGTPASRIHWPAVARGAGLLERRLLPDGDSSPLVVLDARGPGPEALLDAAVRAAASLTLELARKEGCDLLLPGQRRALHIGRDLAAWPDAHARLALVEGGPEAQMPLLGPARRSGTIFYVAARPLRDPPVPAEGRMGVILVLPRELAGVRPQPASFEVSGCTGIVIGASRRRRRAEHGGVRTAAR
jgi:uncharacterized protein (DUF58 family)